MGAVAAADLAAVFVFGVSGALLAGRKGLDLFGMFVAAFVTGVGGGTLRDLLLDRPVFWTADGRYLLAAAVATAAVFAWGPWFEARGRALSWADALGLAVAAPLGVAAARETGASWPILVAMGVATASFGGVIRDLLCGAPPMILHREVYATAAMAGAAANVAAFAATGSHAGAAALCAAVTFGVRAGAILRGWSAPRYRGPAG
jgi:uncharacterized membrane protein YeiH